MQTTYNIDNVAALPGMAVEVKGKVAKYQCSEEIPPGRMVELHTDGKLRLYQGGKRVGISMYRSAKEPGAWAIDDYVPVLRQGQIYADFKGTAASVADLTDANVYGADTTATDRGKITEASQTSASDAQIWDAGPVKFFGAASGNTGYVLVELNFPADEAESLTPILLSHASNDFAVPATAKMGQVFELNTTAANATVSLPTAIKNGTVLYFLADGTKNGHTLTFRDVTTAISAATTASKRVAAVAIKAGGAWAITLTVGP